MNVCHAQISCKWNFDKPKIAASHPYTGELEEKDPPPHTHLVVLIWHYMAINIIPLAVSNTRLLLIKFCMPKLFYESWLVWVKWPFDSKVFPPSSQENITCVNTLLFSVMSILWSSHRSNRPLPSSPLSFLTQPFCRIERWGGSRELWTLFMLTLR